MVNGIARVPSGAAETQRRSADRIIAALAAGQHGRVARRQLLEHGVTRHEIGSRLAHGRLHLEHRGVYAVGHPGATFRSAWMSAVLAAGPSAVLSHRAAAAHWGLMSWSGRPEVIRPPGGHVLPGIVVRRPALRADEAEVRDGIPVTAPARTLFDLAAVLDLHTLRRAFNEAEYLELGSEVPLPELLERHPGRRGAAKLRAVLALGGQGARRLRSGLEVRFARVLDDAGLPRPETNVHVWTGTKLVEVDCLYRARRLIVEVDGAGHRRASAFESDREKDLALAAAGYRTVRITAARLAADRPALVAQLRRLLAP